MILSIHAIMNVLGDLHDESRSLGTSRQDREYPEVVNVKHAWCSRQC